MRLYRALPRQFCDSCHWHIAYTTEFEMVCGILPIFPNGIWHIELEAILCHLFQGRVLEYPVKKSGSLIKLSTESGRVFGGISNNYAGNLSMGEPDDWGRLARASGLLLTSGTSSLCTNNYKLNAGHHARKHGCKQLEDAHGKDTLTLQRERLTMPAMPCSLAYPGSAPPINCFENTLPAASHERQLPTQT